MAYDGSVAIDLELNAKKAKQTTDDLEKHIEKIFKVSAGKKADSQFIQLQSQMMKSKQKADALKNTMKQLETTKVPTDEYKAFSKTLQDANKDLDRLQNKEIDLLNKREAIQERIAKGVSAKENKQLTNQLNKVDDQIKIIDAHIAETENKIAETEGQLQGLVNTGKDFTLGSDTAEYEKVWRALGEVNNQMRVSIEKANNFSMVFDGINYSIEKTKTEARALTDVLNEDVGRPAIQNIDELNTIITDLENQLTEVEQDLDSLDEAIDTTNAEEFSDTVTDIQGEISDMTQSLENMIVDMQELLNSGQLTDEQAALVQERIQALSEDLQNAAQDAADIAPAMEETSEEASKSEKHIVSMREALGMLPGILGRGFVETLKRAASAAGELAKNLIKATGSAIRSGFSRLINIITGLGKSAKSASSGMNGLAHSAITIGSLVKAAIGISSLVVLFRKLKSAVSEGMSNLVQFNGGVNSASSAMASLTSSLTYVKNAWGAAFAPIFSYVAPALTYLIDLIAVAANKLGMLFAAMTGKTSFIAAKKTDVSKAAGGGGSSGKTPEEKYEEAKKKAQERYEKQVAKVQEQRTKAAAKAEEQQAKAAEKLAKAQDKANKQLGDYDELNIIITEDFEDLEEAYEMPDFEEPELEEPDWEDFAAGGGAAIEEMFEEVPIDPWIQELADKINKLIDDLTKPLKQAWDEMGDYVVGGFKKMIGELGGLFGDIGRDFLKVWQQAETVEMFKNILGIVGDIENVIANIAHNLREAWNFNDTGLHILEHIRDIFAVLIDHVRNVTTYMKEWSASLDFKPLLTSFDELLVKLKDVADFIGGVFEDKWKDLILPFVKYLIEEALPKLNQALADIIDVVDWDLLRTNIDKVFEAIEQLAEEIVNGLIMAFGDLGKEVADFVNSEEFTGFVDDLVAAIKSIKGEDIAKILTGIGKGIIKIAEGVIKFIRGITGSQAFQDLMKTITDWWNNTDADDIADVLLKIANAIIMFEFAKFAGAGFLNFMKFMSVLKGGIGGGGALGGGGAAGGGGIFGGLLSGLALLVVTALEAYQAYQELDDMIAFNASNTLPKSADATNGYTDEINGLSGALVDLYAAVTGQEPISHQIVVPSDLEKLEKMYGDVEYLDRSFDHWGITSGETRDKLERLYELGGTHGENLKNLTDDQVTEFNKLYFEVEGVYEKLKAYDPEGMNAWIKDTELGRAQWEELKKSLMDTESPIQRIADKFTEGMDKIKTEAEIMSQSVVRGNRGAIDSFKEMEDSVPKEEQGREKGEAFSKGWLQSAADKIRSSANELQNAGEDVAAGLLVGVQNGMMLIDVDGTWGILLTTFQDFYQIGSPSKVMEEQGTYLVEGLEIGIKDRWELLMIYLTEELEKLQEFFKEHWKEIQEDVSESWELIKKSVTEKFTQVRSVINTNSQAVKNVIREMVSAVSDLFRNLSSNIDREISKIEDSLDGLVDSVKSAISEVQSAVSELSEMTNSAMSNVGTAMTTISGAKMNIPHLAQGAVIPPHSQFLAVLGDQKSGTNIETPLKTMVQAFEMALDDRGGSSNNQPIVLQLDGRTIAEVVWDEEEKRYKQRGSSGFAFT